MAQEENREAVLGEIESARRKGLLRLGIESEEQGHYSEAIDGYRQIIDQYFGTPEEKEAKKRMLDLAYFFEKQGSLTRRSISTGSWNNSTRRRRTGTSRRRGRGECRRYWKRSTLKNEPRRSAGPGSRNPKRSAHSAIAYRH